MNCHSDNLKPTALILVVLLFLSVPAWSQKPTKEQEQQAKEIRIIYKKNGSGKTTINGKEIKNNVNESFDKTNNGQFQVDENVKKSDITVNVSNIQGTDQNTPKQKEPTSNTSNDDVRRQRQIDSLKTLISNTGNDLDNIDKDLFVKNDSLDWIQGQIKSFESALQSPITNIEANQKTLAEYETTKVNLEKEINNLNTEKTKQLDELKGLVGQLGDICPTCLKGNE